MMEWISVNDRLPDVNKTKYDIEIVTVIASNGYWSKPMLYERAIVRGKTVYRWKYVYDVIYHDHDISHWMPLPEPPKY